MVAGALTMAKHTRVMAKSLLAIGRAALNAGSEEALISLARTIQARQKPGVGLGPKERVGLSDLIREGIGSGELRVGDARNLLKIAPEVEPVLPAEIKNQLGNYKSLSFGEVEVEVLSPRGVEELEKASPELTDSAAYEAQFDAAGQATDFAFEPIAEGKGPLRLQILAERRWCFVLCAVLYSGKCQRKPVQCGQ